MNRLSAGNLIWPLLFLVGPALGYSQDSRLIVLENADSLIGRVIDGENARELIGNVQIRQGTMQIACQRALQFLERGVVFLEGKVVLRDDSVTITAPRGIYHRDDRRAEALDSVRLDDGKAVLTAKYGQYFLSTETAVFRTDVIVRESTSVIAADSLVYIRPESRALANGRVAVHSIPDNVTIFGGKLDHHATGGITTITVNPVLIQSDSMASGSRDTLMVRSRVMQSFRDSVRRFVATDSVRVVRSDLAAVGERALFFIEGDSILLRGSPVIWYGATQVTGDSVNAYLLDRRLQRLAVFGRAFAISRNDTLRPDRFDQLTAERIDMAFEDGAITRIRADTRATSIYNLYEDSLANGLNRSSGDQIVMEFAERRIRVIRILGGVEGHYVPEPMVRYSVEEFRLPGFSWRMDRPVMNVSREQWTSHTRLAQFAR